MNVKELFEKTPWEDVKKIIEETCNDADVNMENYKKVFFELRDQLIPRVDADCEKDELVIDWDEGHMYLIAFARKADGGAYALDFNPWENCLALTVSSTSLQLFKPEEIVVSALYDMTFDGFDQEAIKESLERLKNRM